MWICKICDAEVKDDTWTECWKCSGDRGATPSEVEKLRSRIEKATTCLRCEGEMLYAGTKRIHSGTISGFLGEMQRLVNGPDAYDVYYCRSCGKVELYVDGIGDSKRGEPPG